MTLKSEPSGGGPESSFQKSIFKQGQCGVLGNKGIGLLTSFIKTVKHTGIEII